jgi:hypothetical protein
VAHDIAAHKRRLHALAFSPDGRVLSSGGDDRDLCCWDTQTGQKLHAIGARPGKIQSLVYVSPTAIAAGMSDNRVRIWDLATQTEILRLVGHTGSVSALRYHAPTGTLVTASFDTSVRVWHADVEAGKVATQPGEATQVK